MKCLIVNGHLRVGGVERSLLDLLHAIDTSKHQVDLLLLEDLGECMSEIPKDVRVIYWDLKPAYGSLHQVFIRSWRERKLSWFLLKIIFLLAYRISPRFYTMLSWFHKVEKYYDCAIAYRVDLPLYYVAFAARARVKCVWWHNGRFDYDERRVKSWRKAFEKIHHIVCVSQATKNMIEPYFPGLEEKMTVIPNMINSERIVHAAEQFDPYDGFADRTILVSVGRLSEEKHMGDTVDVMQKLLTRGYHDLIWFLVGDGPQRHFIEERIHKLGLEHYFVLTGNQVNPYPYIKHADLFVHPSWVESQGIAVLEAMALERPCVVVRSAGTEEFVVDGVNALLAERTTDSLADKIESALQRQKCQKQDEQKSTVSSFAPDRILSMINNLISTC